MYALSSRCSTIISLARQMKHTRDMSLMSGTAEAGTETNDWLCFLTSFIFIAKRQSYKHTTHNEYMFIIHRYIYTLNCYTPGRPTSIHSVILAMQWVAYVLLPVKMILTAIGLHNIHKPIPNIIPAQHDITTIPVTQVIVDPKYTYNIITENNRLYTHAIRLRVYI